MKFVVLPRLFCRAVVPLSLACALLLSFAAVQAGLPTGRLGTTDDGLTVMAGQEHTIFFSPDGQGNWVQLENLPPGQRYGLYPHPDGGAWLAASSGLYWHDNPLTADGQDGNRWQLLTEQPVAWAAPAPSGSCVLLRVFGRGLYWASAQGLGHPAAAEDWTALRLPVESPPNTAAITAEGHIYLGIFGRGVFFSDDQGEHWQDMTAPAMGTQILLLTSGPAGSVYGATFGGGLWVFTPEAETWSPAAPMLAEATVESIAASQAGILVGTRDSGLAYSEDGGSQWQSVPDPVAMDIRGTAAAADGWWYAYTEDGSLYRATAPAGPWSQQPYAFLNRVQKAAVDTDGFCYAAVTGVGLLRSSDLGRTWRLLDLPETWNADMHFAVAADGRLYLGYETRLYESADQGRNWKLLEPFWGEGHVSALDTAADGRLFFAANQRQGLFVLAPGQDWKGVPVEEPWDRSYHVRDLLLTPGAIMAYGVLDSVAETESGSFVNTHFAQMGRGFFRRTDGTLATERSRSWFGWDDTMAVWKNIEPVPEKEQFTMFSALGTDATAAASRGAIMLRSDEGWSPMDIPFAEETILTLAGQGPSLLLAGTSQGLWISEDRGSSWQFVNPYERMRENEVTGEE